MLLTLILAVAAPIPKTEPADWKAAIKDRVFKFEDEHTGAASGIATAKKAGLATAEFTPDQSDRYGDFTFAKKDGPKVTFHGHAQSAIVVRGDAIYFADYSPNSTGCRIIAHNLATGKKAWSQALEGLGPIDHTKYHNKVAMRVEQHPKVKDAFALVIISQESSGTYIEVIDLDTGKQLANKKFDSTGQPRQ